MTKTTNDYINLFTKANALLEGHFELSSGKHSNQYFQCALVLQHPEYCELLAKALGEAYDGQSIDCVIGPALGGITLAYELGRQLSCRAIFTERKEEVMQLRRGFSFSSGEKVLIVEDVVTTGSSIIEVAKLLESMNVEIVGFAAIVDRNDGAVSFPYPLKSLVQMIPQLFEPNQCPLCEKGVPLVKPGSKK